MNDSVSFRRIALVMALAVLVLCGLAGPLPAADAPFTFAGDVKLVDRVGNDNIFAWEGRATHLGPCTGVGLVWSAPHGHRALVTLENSQGDSIDFFMEWIRNEKTGEGVGTYEIIGGTGRFADATGVGSLHVIPGEGVFLDGTISY
jgi:hypothetical protein